MRVFTRVELCIEKMEQHVEFSDRITDLNFRFENNKEVKVVQWQYLFVVVPSLKP